MERRGTLPHLQTWTQHYNNDKVESNLEVIFVHGCKNRAPKLARSLQQTAEHIFQRLSPHRFHIWSYDTAKLLHKGLNRYRKLYQRLLDALAELTSKAAQNTNFAFVTHNTGLWLVQKVLVEWQYSANNGRLPVGVIAVSLPGAQPRDKWEAADWPPFCRALLRRLREEHRVATLQYETIEETVADFDQLLDDVKRRGDELKFTELKSVQNISRASTEVSRESDSSVESNEDSKTGFTKIEPEEAAEIVDFLREACTATPVNIPALRLSRNRRDLSVSKPGSRNPSGDRMRDILGSSPRGVDSDLTRGVKPAENPSSRTDASTAMSCATCKSVERSESQRSSRLQHRSEPRSTEGTSKTATIDEPYKDTHAAQEDGERSDEQNTGKIPRLPDAHRTELKHNKKLASDYYDRGDFVEARRRFKFVIKSYSTYRKDKSYYRICLNLAQISWYRGKYPSAKTKFETLFADMLSLGKEEKDPKLIGDAGKWLALSQWKLGDYKDAEMTIATCCEMFERDPQASLLSTWALVLASLGAFKRAWDLSTKAKSLAETSMGGNDRDIRGANDVKIDQQNGPQEAVMSADYRTCLFNHARISTEMGRFSEAALENEKVLRDLQKRLGPKHIATLDAASLRAWLLVFENNPTQSGEEVLRTLRQMRERLGEQHPSTLQAVQTLVLMYKSDGRYSDAQETARYLVNRCESSEVLGRTHPQTLKSKAMLADVLLAIGDWNQAKEIQSEVILAEKENFFFRTAMANICRTRGEWDPAHRQAIEVLLDELRMFGSEDEWTKKDDEYEGEQIGRDVLRKMLFSCERVHRSITECLSVEGSQDPFQGSEPFRVYPSMVQTLHCLALCEQVRDDADLDFVHDLLRTIHDILDRRLSPMHRLAVNVQHDIAVNHRLRGEFSESLKLLDIVVSERQKSLGSDHPDYLVSKHQHAVTLFRLSKWQRALEEQESTLSTQEFLLGKHHADVVISRYTLSGIYHSLSRFEEADALLSLVIKDQIDLYGRDAENPKDHPIVLRSRARHALIRLDMLDFTGAEAEQTMVLKRREDKFGIEHSLSRNAKNDLAQIKQAAGKLREAERLYKELLSLQGTQLMLRPHQNAFVFQVQSNLASCLFEIGQETQEYGEAKSMQEVLYAQMRTAFLEGEPDERFIAVTFNLALTNKAMRHHDEALERLREAHGAATKLLGTKHPQTQELQITLDAWSKEQAVRDHTYVQEPVTGEREYRNQVDVAVPDNRHTFAKNADLQYHASVPGDLQAT